MSVVYHQDAYFEKTPLEKQRVCCNCRHRVPGTVDRCNIDRHYIGYIECFTAWCKYWATDELQWKEGDSK